MQVAVIESVCRTERIASELLVNRAEDWRSSSCIAGIRVRQSRKIYIGRLAFAPQTELVKARQRSPSILFEPLTPF